MRIGGQAKGERKEAGRATRRKLDIGEQETLAPTTARKRAGQSGGIYSDPLLPPSSRRLRTGCLRATVCAYWQPVMAGRADSSDEELMLRYRDGDAGAFDELYRRHKGSLYRYLLRQCRDSGAAEELFQDIWMNLIRAHAGYTVAAKFTTYLYRLAHNRLIDHYRKHARAVWLSFDDEEGSALEEPAASGEGQPETRYESKQLAERLLALLGALPEAQREAFVLQYETGMTIEEIAIATGVSRETAKSRLRYALTKLRQGMGEWR